VFALSDIHVDYEANAKWIANLSAADYQEDVLILAGDATNRLGLLSWCLSTLARRFKKLLFIPGNHELWTIGEDRGKNSLEKFDDVVAAAQSSGASMRAFRAPGLSIIPLLAWYDYSFGDPSEELRSIWADYHVCRWPGGLTDRDIAAHFARLNNSQLNTTGDVVITYSHFLPRIDLIPPFVPKTRRVLCPVLGSIAIEGQLRRLRSNIHIYGHSHVNRYVTIEGIRYVNNAFGYPCETLFTAKQLACVYQS